MVWVASFCIHKCLTGNGSEFTDRLLVKAKHPTGTHLFDQTCADHAIEHRLIPPRHPQTHGLLERFNDHIAEVL
ncbi:DDE-type integrase/transposase/recombinase [Methylococcus capsulatus]|nr:DDE-type integrase/transposase/recombinase [Methylococcus capsulatus]